MSSTLSGLALRLLHVVYDKALHIFQNYWSRAQSTLYLTHPARQSRYITKATKQQVMLRQLSSDGHYVCACCLVIIKTSGDRVLGHFSHFKPHSRGGSNEVDNLMYCCFNCNLETMATHPAVYYAKIGDDVRCARMLALNVPDEDDYGELIVGPKSKREVATELLVCAKLIKRTRRR